MERLDANVFESDRLLLKYQRWSAYSLPFEVHRHLDSVRDLDERNAAIHTVVLAIKCHGPRDRAGA